MHKYKQHRNTLTQVAAAAKAGISERSARHIDHTDTLPSQHPARRWRTREDPLTAVWDAEVVPLPQGDAKLNAVTLLEELQCRHPGDYGVGVLRTLQRRMRQWRVTHGTERDIYFAQEHPPGRLGLSDFTVCDELGIELDGAAFPHRLYQFALAHSGWRHAEVSVGGESFIALSARLQAALWRLGAEPAMTLAAVDRLVHHSTILEMNVESYRRRENAADQRNRSPPPTGQDSCRRADKIVDAGQARRSVGRYLDIHGRTHRFDDCR